MAVTPVVATFCLAVSDGVASSNHSQGCSKAMVKAIRRLWGNQKSITSDDIHQLINQPSIQLSVMVRRQRSRWLPVS